MPSVEHEEMVARIVATGMRTPEEADPALIAAMRDHELAAPRPDIADMRVTDVVHGGVPCLEVTPADGEIGETVGTVVYVHGGGYIWMRAATHLAVAAAFVRATGCRCVSVDYRRAPSTPSPLRSRTSSRCTRHSSTRVRHPAPLRLPATPPAADW